jgi:molybdopterin-guanine dinucleotide biosynthesis protein A
MSTAEFTLVINAGGTSRRMGREKALLPVPPTGQPLLRYLLTRLQGLSVAQRVVITNNPALADHAGLDDTVLFVPDAYPGGGALGGIATGLRQCPTWAIVVACDLPLLNPALLTYLCTLVNEETATRPLRWQAIVPRVAGYAQTLHALYHRSLLPHFEANLAQGELRIHRLLPAVQTRWVDEAELRTLDPDLHSFFNANTPEEWQQVCALLND